MALQDALAEAVVDPTISEIWVAQGTYFPDEGVAQTDGDRNAAFELLAGLAVYGGFVGGETELSQRDPVLNVTVLSGDIGIVEDITDNSFHVVFADADAGTTARLDGFTITAGNANGGGNSGRGGGILLAVVQVSSEASPFIVRCVFRNNFANFGGGAANGQAGGSEDPTYINCSFLDNEAANDGGALMNDGDSALLVNCLFAGNTAGGRGGAIFDVGQSSFFGRQTTPTLINCTISDNTALNGGGVFDEFLVVGGHDAQATLANCIVWGNSPDQIVDEDGVGTIVNFSDVQGGFVGGAGNIDADPMFVDALAGDFRLQLGSPANDVGSNQFVPTDSADLDGDSDLTERTPLDLVIRPRFVADAGVSSFCDPVRVDMGAFESADCNGNLIRDEDEIAGGAADANGDGILDECQDCNNNLIFDSDEIAATPALDCNLNGRLDECDLIEGCSFDVNTNMLPDECECGGFDIVFVIDTSNSMLGPNEMQDVCDMIADVEADLNLLFPTVLVRVTSYRIGDVFVPSTCTELSVAEVLAPDENSMTCPGDLVSNQESWGSATEVVAEFFPWLADRKRVIVPISDECPCDGDPCNVCDDDSIAGAIAAAAANHAFVFPIVGVGASNETVTRAIAVAFGTGGQLDIAATVTEYAAPGGVGDRLVPRLMSLPTFCPTDINGDGVTNVLDLIDLLLCFGQPAVPGCEAEDVNGNGMVEVLDLIDLLLEFGTGCLCDPPTQQSLEEELRDAGLTMDDWDDFMDVMQNGTQEEKENWHCWMTHYLQGCPISRGQFCGGPNCPDDDPFDKH